MEAGPLPTADRPTEAERGRAVAGSKVNLAGILVKLVDVGWRPASDRRSTNRSRRAGQVDEVELGRDPGEVERGARGGRRGARWQLGRALVKLVGRRLGSTSFRPPIDQQKRSAVARWPEAKSHCQAPGEVGWKCLAVDQLPRLRPTSRSGARSRGGRKQSQVGRILPSWLDAGWGRPASAPPIDQQKRSAVKLTHTTAVEVGSCLSPEARPLPTTERPTEAARGQAEFGSGCRPHPGRVAGRQRGRQPASDHRATQKRARQPRSVCVTDDTEARVSSFRRGRTAPTTRHDGGAPAAVGSDGARYCAGPTSDR